MNNEILKIDRLLKKRGYFLFEKQIIQKSQYELIVVYKLGFLVSHAHIYVPKSINHPKKGDSIRLKISEVESFLQNMVLNKDLIGKSFSEISLKNLSVNKNILYATLHIKESTVRKVNTIIVKGYERIAKKTIQYDLNINEGDLFNKRKLNTISQLTKTLPFVEEIKPPEVLFTKDSTILYLYLRKKRNNSFDGIASFASKENNGGVLFNGTADLKLNNILDGGERLTIFWNSIGNERQEFSLSSKVPYIFNSRISPEVSFNIYKQDSTFLNTQFHSKILYKLNSKSSISFNYSSLASNNLKEDIVNNNVESFNNNLLGIGYSYQGLTTNSLVPTGFTLFFEALYGTRKSDNSNDPQTKINLDVSNIFSFNPRNQIYIRNQTGILLSDIFLENEIYRIGGVNSIRGFNEQSIFTSRYSYINLEYRYLTSRASYFYSISDFGIAKTLNASNETILGLGFGYLFTIKNTQVNLGYVLGKSTDNDFNLSNSKLNISFKSYF